MLQYHRDRNASKYIGSKVGRGSYLTVMLMSRVAPIRQRRMRLVYDNGVGNSYATFLEAYMSDAAGSLYQY